MRLGHARAAAVPALLGARRLALLPLMAAAFLAGACRGDSDAEDEQAPPAAVPAAAPAGNDGTAGTPPAAAAAPAGPMTVEDSIRMARDDSTALAKDYHQRLGSMETYAGCMQKAKGADPQQRPVLEAACARARGAPR